MTVTDNEKLIERARLTPKDAPRNLIPLVLELANALEAAEKPLGEATVTPTAHEVTTDERDALADRLFAFAQGASMADLKNGRTDTLLAAVAVLRRTEEPNAEHDRDRMGICSKCGQGLNALDVLDGERPCVPSEPQGEPSDVQVSQYEKAMRERGEWVDDESEPTEAQVQAALKAWYSSGHYRSSEGMRVALRAAGEVR